VIIVEDNIELFDENSKQTMEQIRQINVYLHVSFKIMDNINNKERTT
jgi:hypothetical protein